jgi:hypothetical protein
VPRKTKIKKAEKSYDKKCRHTANSVSRLPMFTPAGEKLKIETVSQIYAVGIQRKDAKGEWQNSKRPTKKSAREQEP